MNTFLLAAGLGKRLRPLTLKTPKILVKIKQKTLLDYWLDSLSKIKTKKIFINTHYLSKKIENHIYQSKFKNKIILIKEKKLYGTGGSLIKNIKFFENEDLLFAHGDNFSLFEINKFIQAHHNRPKKCLFTMLTFKTFLPKESGIVKFDKNNILIDYHEKPSKPNSNIANGAVFILSKEFLSIIKNKENKVKDFSKEIIRKYLGKIYIYYIDEYFVDIGTKEALKDARKFMESKSKKLNK